MECVATTAFGIEAVCRRELETLDVSIKETKNGRVYFDTDQRGMMRTNLHLRTAERVHIVLGRGEVRSFDELFAFLEKLPLERFFRTEGKFIVNAKSVKSTLFSLRDIQSVGKKAILENLKSKSPDAVFPETAEPYRILISIEKDGIEVWLDTSGEPLHKRGYRESTGDAPIKETLAAAIVLLSFYDHTRTLYDPFTGSGTFPIEAARIARNIPPGLDRGFDFEAFPFFDESLFKQEKRRAYEGIRHGLIAPIRASDIDADMVKTAGRNAEKAGVAADIVFNTADFCDMSFEDSHPVVITNPPYGERLMQEGNLQRIYKDLGRIIRREKDASFYILTPVANVEGLFQKKASRTRVLFNGPIKTRLYQYFGPPPKKRS